MDTSYKTMKRRRRVCNPLNVLKCEHNITRRNHEWYTLATYIVTISVIVSDILLCENQIQPLFQR